MTPGAASGEQDTSNVMVPKAQYDAMKAERDGWKATAEELSRPVEKVIATLRARGEWAAPPDAPSLRAALERQAREHEAAGAQSMWVPVAALLDLLAAAPAPAAEGCCDDPACDQPYGHSGQHTAFSPIEALRQSLDGAIGRVRVSGRAVAVNASHYAAHVDVRLRERGFAIAPLTALPAQATGSGGLDLADAFTWFHVRISGMCQESHRADAAAYAATLGGREAE